MKIKKEAVYVGIIIILAALCAQFYYSFKWKPAREIRVYYNQDIAANEQIANTVRQADKFVYFAIYTFTLSDIKDALLGAKYRGLDVEGLVDRDQTAGLEAQAKLVKELRDAGIPVAVEDHSGIMHMKAVVTDKAYASGSYNWTSAATKINDEVLEVGTDPGVRQQYQSLLTKVIHKYAK